MCSLLKYSRCSPLSSRASRERWVSVSASTLRSSDPLCLLDGIRGWRDHLAGEGCVGTPGRHKYCIPLPGNTSFPPSLRPNPLSQSQPSLPPTLLSSLCQTSNWWSQIKTAGSAIYANRHYLALYRCTVRVSWAWPLTQGCQQAYMGVMGRINIDVLLNSHCKA